MRDVTKQRELMAKLNELASYDTLSQVYNRRKLMEEAEKEAERAVRYYDCPVCADDRHRPFLKKRQ